VADAPAPETLDGERKTVTALFADIKGSMELIEDLDPEEARTLVDPALKLMIDAVHHYGGYVAQSTGDGIFALFGAPAAHEDHPQCGFPSRPGALNRRSLRPDIWLQLTTPILGRRLSLGAGSIYGTKIPGHVTCARPILSPSEAKIKKIAPRTKRSLSPTYGTSSPRSAVAAAKDCARPCASGLAFSI